MLGTASEVPRGRIMTGGGWLKVTFRAVLTKMKEDLEMLSINWDDVIKVINTIIPHLVVIGVALIAAIVATVLFKKLSKPVKGLARGSAWIAALLVIVIVLNLICTGPMSTLLSSVAGKPVSTISEESSAEASALCAQVIEEGAVLLENDGILPLASGTKLNVFGWASSNPVYGGTGSGSLNTNYHTVSIIEGLNNAGIETNEELTKFYVDYKADRPDVNMSTQDWTLPEPAVSLYSDAMMSNASAYSDTALVVIGRVGGEGADLPTDMAAVVDGSWAASNPAAYYQGSYDDTLNAGNDWDKGDHFLELSNREEDLLELVCSKFDDVIVLYNGANPFELGFVEDYPQIKGLLWCAGTGQTGFNGLGSILSGAANPSGRLIDTYLYDMSATPTWNNFGDFIYTNMTEFTVAGSMFSPADTYPAFVNYVEGIYVGYKFYETAAVEGLIDYDATVQYPFGYGLSYTTFEQEMSDVTESGGNLNFTVTVTNTGSKAGKDVVEVYVNPPYINGGIEKASANLLDFGKTKNLEPGASETIEFSIPVEELASYDSEDAGCYVLERGDYIVSINSDSHNILDSHVYTVNSTITYNENNKRSSDQTVAVNQLSFADHGFEGLSRKDGFANYATATAAPTNWEMDAEYKATFYNISNYLTAEATAADEDPNAVMPVTGAKNNLKLETLRSADYDDPQWDSLLDQLTVEEMNTMISLGGFQTAAIESIGKYSTNDCDGPASINNNFTRQGSIGFPAGVMIAATWSKDIALSFGLSIGRMAAEMDTAGWYAPAMNIHRSAFAGRNFEYYSEDPRLSGMVAAQAVIGAEEYGVYAYLKHFAFNDQEGNRNGMLCTWADEQALREIYLKPFEIAVKEGHAKAIMSSFNYIGNRWAGGCNELCNVILRDEWGFRGMVLSDYFGVYGYMSADQGIRNGTDFMLVSYPTETNDVRFRETPGAVQAMRTAVKNILYVTVNSRQYSEQGIEMSTQPNRWETYLTIADVIIGVALVGFEVLLVYNYMKRKKDQ